MEKDLFNPVKAYFEALGYVCDGEVNDIDLYMEMQGESVAVELKQTLDFKAVQQAALRQKVADTVYIAIFKPKDMYSHSFKDKLYLLKRLGIGLITVSKRSFAVELASPPLVTPIESYKRCNKGKKEALKKEFSKRRTKINTGGVTGVNLITSYREDALLVLDALVELGGEADTKSIRALSKVERSTNILHDNHYGWFLPVKRGVYGTSSKGYDALEEFEEAIYALKRGTWKKM